MTAARRLVFTGGVIAFILGGGGGVAA